MPARPSAEAGQPGLILGAVRDSLKLVLHGTNDVIHCELCYMLTVELFIAKIMTLS